jgi:hypothetical protein
MVLAADGTSVPMASEQPFPSADDGRCRTCGNTFVWHEMTPQAMHSFNDGSVPFSATFGGNAPRRTGAAASDAQRPAEALPWPHDPVLRQALIDRGVITPDDLRDAEAKIRAVTAEFLGRGH